MKGRKPKPTKLRILQGMAGHRPLPKDEPVPTGKAVKPAWLDDYPPVSRIWDELAPGVEAMGLLTDVDVEAFARYCTLQAEFRKGPEQFTSSRMARLSALEACFGMEPSARARLGTKSGQKPANPFADVG